MASTASMASTADYDEDGMPVLDDAKKIAVKQERAQSEFLMPTHPQTPLAAGKKRKQQVLATRSLLTPSDETPPKAAAKTTPKADFCVQLFLPRLSISKGRAELCCKDSEGKRIFVWGSTARQHGVNLDKLGKSLLAHLEKNPGITKGEAIKHKDQLICNLA